MTSSLMRGWVCSLQLLLVLASVVILRSEFCGTHDHNLLSESSSAGLMTTIYCLRVEIPPVFISPRKRLAQLYPQALGTLFFVDRIEDTASMVSLLYQ
jgi:hypothetical protein